MKKLIRFISLLLMSFLLLQACQIDNKNKKKEKDDLSLAQEAGEEVVEQGFKLLTPKAFALVDETNQSALLV